MEYLYHFLKWVMDSCYQQLHNYGAAIILFTFISKIVLLPVSIWTYMNSVTMIRIQADINFIKIKYYGQKDLIAEEQTKLFRDRKYHPLASVIPLAIQLILLVGVVAVIRDGMADPLINMSLGNIDLGQIPANIGFRLIWSPVLAGLSAWVLCVVQNHSNILQAEQSKYNKYITMAISVSLSLYLGWFVPIGTSLYWICSNLMAVIQLWFLNGIIHPWKYVDYEKLEESRKVLSQMQKIGNKKREHYFSENKKRERRDYKKFFSVVNKHLVFYSESNGFYKYFRGIIECLLKNTNLIVHYITSDPDDSVFELEKDNPKIRGYYIGENKLITLMMKMDADVVVMTMPDLNNFHIKRSYIKKDIEYIFVQHGMGSNNLGMRKGCLDHFDTIFCAGPHQVAEVMETEKVYGLSPKNLVKVGYPLIDEITHAYLSGNFKENERKKILIAPSWQPENIVDSCLEKILSGLRDSDYDVIVRPHPQEVRMKQEYMAILKQKYECSHIKIQTDFSSDTPIIEADLLITDWSGISWEYAFSTLKPILFIDTPMKVMNPEYQKIPTVPLNILIRDKLGIVLKLNELDQVPDTIAYLLMHKDEYGRQINELADQYLYYRGTSAEKGADYIIKTIQKKIAEKGDFVS